MKSKFLVASILLIFTGELFAQFTQQGPKIVATGGIGASEQGFSVAISSDGNTAIVGGPNDNYQVGAVWVFTRTGGIWTQQGTKLVGTGAVGNYSQQGYSVTISADGNSAVIGGPNDNSFSGAIWIFNRVNNVWSQLGPKLVGTGAIGNSEQGLSVAISSDGNTIVEGGPFDNGNIGALWVFTRSGSVWYQQGAKIIGSGSGGSPEQGFSLAVSSDGNTFIEGGVNDNAGTGAMWVFTRNGSVWTQQGTKLVGTGGVGTTHQGVSVAISSNGNTAVSGGFYDNSGVGAVWIYTQSGGVWTQQGSKLVGSGTAGFAQQGFSVAVSSDGNTVIDGGCYDNNQVGAIWVFNRNGGIWTQQGTKLVGTGAVGSIVYQGRTVSVSSDGNTAVEGGFYDNTGFGASWVFVRMTSVPILSSPANNSSGQGTSLNLVWNRSAYANKYRVQVATDSLFNNTVVNDSTVTDSVKAVSGLLYNTLYYWRVNATNSAGTSAYSTTWHFTTVPPIPAAPVLLSPSNNSVGQALSLNLVWNKTTYAANYRVQLSTDSLFTNLIVNDSTLTDSIKAVSGLNGLTNYWWRVNAKNVSGTSAYSTAFKFRTLGVPARITGTFVPANGSVNQPTTINFRWSKTFDQTLKIIDRPVKNNSQTVSNYWFEITTDSVSLAGIVRDSLLTDTNKTMSGLNYSTSYYWRVKAKNQIGWGAFSFWQKFTTVPPPPATVTLKVIPGGFYDNAAGMLRTRDTIRVYLVDSASCLRVDSNKVVIDSVTFSANLSFSIAPTGAYYLFIYHRNHLPVATRFRQNIIRGSNINYDMTTDSAKAYGFNMIRVSNTPVRWGMIPGDANRDEFIDGLDQTIWATQNGLDGYQTADFNGDGFVDGLDQTLWVINNGNSSNLPCSTPNLSFKVGDSDARKEILYPVIKNYKLYDNYPNPFNPTTRIMYVVPKAGFTTLKIYDALGSEVLTLVNEMKQPGVYNVEFDGIKFASGVYFYKLESGSFTQSKKMLLVK